MNLELLYISFLVLFGIIIITLTVIGIFLLYKGIKNKMVNIILVGIAFVSLPIGFIGYFVFQLDPLFQELIIVTSFILTVKLSSGAIFWYPVPAKHASGTCGTRSGRS